MKPNRIITYLIVLFSFSIISACGDITGNSNESGFSDWKKGMTIVPADDQHLSEEQRIRYRQDAEKLAVRYINEKDSTQTEIPGQLIDLFYNGLIHIVNSDHPEADEAITEYSIHAGNPASPRQILVFADTTAPWVDAWRNGMTETGNAEVDELINRFNFTLVDYNELPNTLPTSMATLQSDHAINVFAVGRLFQELDDIESAHPDFYFGGGRDIKVLFFDDYLRYTFEYGFGDCPAGCINRHFWHFNVYKDGSVEFAGEEGDSLPDG